MKVLHFGCGYRPYRGGSRVRLERLALELDPKKFEISLVTHTPSTDPEDDLPFSAVLRIAATNSLLPSLTIIRFIRAQSPSVVILHNSRVLLIWMLFYRFLFPSVRAVCELHSVRESSRLKHLVNTALYSKCARVVVLSRGAASWLETHHGIDTAEVISNGIQPASSLAIDATLKTRTYDPTAIHFVYAGSFHEWQGVRIIAQAARMLGPEFWRVHRLTYIGDGPAMQDVRSDLGVDLLALDNIQLLGWRSSEETESLVREADFLLAPRPSNAATETVVPMKVTDSVSLSKPLIGSSVGGLAEFLDDPEDGAAAVFVRPGDAADLARAMGAAPDAATYKTLCDGLTQLRDKLPTWAQSAARYANILNEIGASRRS